MAELVSKIEAISTGPVVMAHESEVAEATHCEEIVSWSLFGTIPRSELFIK